MKSVFFNNIPIYLVTDLKQESQNNFYHINNFNWLSLNEEFENSALSSVYLFDSDFKTLWQQFSSQFKVIEAAGGKVYNGKGEILFIYRNDKWDLPKGKIEKGESIEEAGVREVMEETGIENLHILEQLETTYHIYKHKKKFVLKVSYWFRMTTEFKGALLPQQEEGITEAAWLSNDEVNKALENTYENIKLLF